MKKKLLINNIKLKKFKKPLVCLTAYTTPMAEILDKYCDVILVGDSLGMVLHGMKSTREVTLDMMIMHGKRYEEVLIKVYWWLICQLEHMKKIPR